MTFKLHTPVNRWIILQVWSRWHSPKTMCLTSATFIFSPTPWHQRPLKSLNSLIFLTTSTQMNKMTVQNSDWTFSRPAFWASCCFTLHNKAPKSHKSAFSSRDLLMKVPFVDPWSIATRIKSSSTCVIASKCSMQKTKTNSRNTNRPKRESLGCRISLQVAREQCFRDKELCSISISTQPPGTSQNLSAVWSKSVA